MNSAIHLAGNHRNLSAITDEAIRIAAPSVFAEKADGSVSDKYQFVRTIDVLNNMRGAGYEVVQAQQSSTRDESGRPYAKHVVRLVQRDHLNRTGLAVGDVIPQIVLSNSHNRTSAFSLQAGLHRLICSNGLMVASASFTAFRVLHNDPNIFDNIIDGTNLIREVTEAVALPTIEKMMAKSLTTSQVTEFAEAASFLKFGEVRADHVVALNTARRIEDHGDNLWTVLNRVQENAIRGGYMARNAAGHNVKQKGITSVARDLDFNVNLWSLGAKVLELV